MIDSILQRYNFKAFRPGEEKAPLEFRDGGIVVICRDEEDPGTFRVLGAYEAQDPVAMARSRFKRAEKESKDGRVFAYLGDVPKRDRPSVVSSINSASRN